MRCSLGRVAVLVLFALLGQLEAQTAPIALLHQFNGGADDGWEPDAGVTQSDSTLFGTTVSGGDFDRGTAYSVSTNGSGFLLLHDFMGGDSDGRTLWAT